jgi:hypothetical protein
MLRQPHPTVNERTVAVGSGIRYRDRSAQRAMQASMFRLTARKRAIGSGVLGLGLLIAHLAAPRFMVFPAGETMVPIGLIVAILALVYAALNIALHVMQQRQLMLSQQELDQYGDALSAVTPRIFDELREHRPVRQIAQGIEADRGIPADVTLRYIIQALETYKRQGRTLVDQPADAEEASGESGSSG